MKFLPVVLASVSLCCFATLPLHADVPKALRPTVDPKLEAITADQLLRLIRDLRGENGDNGMFDGNQEIDQAVMALAHLGRYQLALQYTYKDGQSSFGDVDMPLPADPLHPMADDDVPAGGVPPAIGTGQQATPSRVLASAWTRSYIYQAAISRKLAYGKRAEARALVPLIKKPEDRLVPLMSLAASALRDNQRAEALADLNNALKWGGIRAAQHEWLGLLIARAGQQATATRIFAARRKRIAEIKEPRDRFEAYSDPNWGSLGVALWCAGNAREALDILQAHPLIAPELMVVVSASKDSPQKRQALRQLAIVPNITRFNDPVSSLIPFSARALDATEITKQLEKAEYNILKKISLRDKTEPDYYDWRLRTLAGVVAAWNYTGQPARAQAFLQRPSTHLNVSERAIVESIALLSVARFKATPKSSSYPSYSRVTLSRAQSAQLCAQLTGLLRQLRYDEIWNNHFSSVTDSALELFLASGDAASARALVKSSEQAIERNWRFSTGIDHPFISEFVNLAGRFARIGDTASMKLWLDRYQARVRSFPKAQPLELYQGAALFQQARSIVDSFSKPVTGPWTPEQEAANTDWEHIMWSRFAYGEADAALAEKSLVFDRPSTPFPLWSQKLPLEARAEALPAFASSLSRRNSSPMMSIRDSGFWEVRE